MPLAKVRGRVSYEKVAHIRKTFREFDVDQSNTIDSKELDSLLRKMAIVLSEGDLHELIQKMDADGSGVIEFSEFLDWYPTICNLVSSAKVTVNPGVRTSTIDWVAIREKLPTEKTEAARKKREKLFREFDPNGNGYLSLAEIDKGFRDVVQLQAIFDVKPVLMRAYQAARKINDKKQKRGSHGPDFVELGEFRMLLWYVRQYFELWQMFGVLDSSGDRRVDLNEFKDMFHKQLPRWGFKMAQGLQAEAEFKRIDKNGGGFILFDEFAEWALAQGLDLEDDDD